jgi:hypothetical protein
MPLPPADKPSGLVQGTLDMLILKTLALQPMHGYGVGFQCGDRELFRCARHPACRGPILHA